MTKFVKCEQCQAQIAGNKCDFAILTRIIDEKEHVFCCKKCAEKYEKKRS